MKVKIPRKRRGEHDHFRVICTCKAVMADCGHDPSAGERKSLQIVNPCMHVLSPDELFQYLVANHVSFREMEPTWEMMALQRLREEWDLPLDMVLARIKTAVAQKSLAAAAMIPGPYA
jgi:hypothetical protein